MKMTDIEIIKGYVPGAIGRIAEMHGTYYHTHWGFGSYFESKVATKLSAFVERYNDRQDGLWTVSKEGRVEGSIVIDGIHAEAEGAHLRWFIMSDQLRGKKFGKKLICTAVDFCKTKGFNRVYLWTFEGLEAARHLYEWAGFRLVTEHHGKQWGTEVHEQRFELRL